MFSAELSHGKWLLQQLSPSVTDCHSCCSGGRAHTLVPQLSSFSLVAWPKHLKKQSALNYQVTKLRMYTLSSSCNGAERIAGGSREQLGPLSASITLARINTEFLLQPVVHLLSLVSEEFSSSAQGMEVSFMTLRPWC